MLSRPKFRGLPTCNICYEIFENMDQFNCHILIHYYLIPPFVCPACYLVFGNSIDLKRHVVIHIPGKYICPTCNKRYKKQAWLVYHLKEHQTPSKNP